MDLHADPDAPNFLVEKRHFMHIKIGGSPEEARDPQFCIFLTFQIFEFSIVMFKKGNMAPCHGKSLHCF